MIRKINFEFTKRKLFLLCTFLLLIIAVWYYFPFLTWVGRAGYYEWVEYQKTNKLTRQYGDELFAVVKGFESRHSLTGYAPRREYCQYVMGHMLDFCYDRWDRLNTDKPQQIPIITKISHPRVFYYSDDISGILVNARQLDVKYDVDDVEIIEASEQSAMISYVLGFEDGKWKVVIKDICVEGEERCVFSLENLGKSWYWTILD